jgi:hypothetical protein
MSESLEALRRVQVLSSEFHRICINSIDEPRKREVRIHIEL